MLLKFRFLYAIWRLALRVRCWAYKRMCRAMDALDAATIKKARETATGFMSFDEVLNELGLDKDGRN